MKIRMLLMLVAVLGLSLLAGTAQATIIANTTDLSYNWPGSQVVATGILDTQGNPQWSLGYSTNPKAIQSPMWGNGNGSPNKGYSWHSTPGWEGELFGGTGVLVTNPLQIGPVFNSSTRDLFEYTMFAAGTYNFEFSLASADSTKRFGIWSVADGIWLGDTTHNPENGTGSLAPIVISATDTAAAGDKYVICGYGSASYRPVPLDTNMSGTITLVPEPGTLALLAAGLLGLLCYAWRKRR